MAQGHLRAYAVGCRKEKLLLMLGVCDVVLIIAVSRCKVGEYAVKHDVWQLCCLCGCGGGIACDISADVGLICNISNWGAYGICAMLAALCGEPEVLHDPATERRMIEACVAAGALDPFSGLHRPWVDGESEDIHADIIELLNTIVAHATTGSYFTRGYQDTWKHKIENL